MYMTLYWRYLGIRMAYNKMFPGPEEAHYILSIE